MNVDAIKAEYRRALGEFETVLLRRYYGTGQNRQKFDAPCLARVMGYAPEQLAGTVQQGDTRLIVMADDLVASGFPLPLTDSDTVIVKGKPLDIKGVDDRTRRVAGKIIAYELQARG